MSIAGDQTIDPAATLSDFALAEMKLHHQPFGYNTPNGENFLDDIAESQLNDIKQALISGDDLLLILGPEGCGKSTLVQQLGSNSGQRIQCFSVRGSERFSTANLFAGMLEAFKRQPPDDLKQMLDELIPALQGMTDSNTLGAVVLDDAHEIPESELTKLLSGMLYLNSSDETLLRVTLAAPTEFEERIPELLPEGADLPYSSLAIDAFDKDRSARYLDFRLQAAGLTDDFPFSDQEIATINEEAGGRPGALHTVAAQHLNLRDENYVAELPPELAGETSKGSRLGAGAGAGFLGTFANPKLLVGAAALAMIFAGLFWLKPSGDMVEDTRYTVVESKKLGTDNTETNSAGSNSEVAANAARLREINEQKNAQNSSQANEQQVAVAEVNTSPETTVATNPNAAAEKAAADKAAAQLQAKLESDAAAKAAEEAAAAEQLAKAQAEQAAAAKAAEEQAAKELAAKEAAAAEAAKTKAAEEAATASLRNLESPNWILVQNPSLFTVQMSASKDRKSVEAFLARNDLPAPNSIFSFKRNDATWYALVHGLYSSIEDARKEVEKMPESARSNQPWIRAIGRIQNAVKEE